MGLTGILSLLKGLGLESPSRVTGKDFWPIVRHMVFMTLQLWLMAGLVLLGHLNGILALFGMQMNTLVAINLSSIVEKKILYLFDS